MDQFRKLLRNIMEINRLAQSFYVQMVDNLPEHATETDIISGSYEGSWQEIGRFNVSEAFLLENPNIEEMQLTKIAMKIFNITCIITSDTTIEQFKDACEGDEKAICKYSLDRRSAFSAAIQKRNYYLAQYILSKGANPSQLIKDVNERTLEKGQKYKTYSTPLSDLIKDTQDSSIFTGPLLKYQSLTNLIRSLLDCNAKIFLHKQSEKNWKELNSHASGQEICCQNIILAEYQNKHAQELQNLYAKCKLLDKFSLIRDISNFIKLKLVGLISARPSI